MSRIQLTALVFALAVVWAVLAAMRGVALSFNMALPLISVAGLGFALIQLFDKYVWRWQWLHPWFVPQPVIEGTWQGLLVSDYIDQKTGERIPPIRAYFRVKQTFSTIHMRLMTKESSSDLLSGKVYCNPDETFAVTGVYLNTPNADVRHRSEIHYGAIYMTIQGDLGVRMEGNYWTGRKTTGTMSFDRRMAHLCSTFAEAEERFTG